MSGNSQQPQLVVQSEDLVTVEYGGVPVLELPSIDGSQGNILRAPVLIKAINFLRSGSSTVQLIMVYESSTTSLNFDRAQGGIESFVGQLEIREGAEAESLHCRFDTKALLVTLTRSVPEKK